MTNSKDITEKELDLTKLTASDFDGHTSFPEMTPEERLLWLSHAAEFAYEFKEKIDTKP